MKLSGNAIRLLADLFVGGMLVLAFWFVRFVSCHGGILAIGGWYYFVMLSPVVLGIIFFGKFQSAVAYTIWKYVGLGDYPFEEEGRFFDVILLPLIVVGFYAFTFFMMQCPTTSG